MTGYVVLASLLVFSWKLLGHLLPQREQSASVQRLTDGITVALLAALVAIQGFANGSQVVIDERTPALVLAALLLAVRAPFIVVVIAAGGVAALLRYFY